MQDLSHRILQLLFIFDFEVFLLKFLNQSKPSQRHSAHHCLLNFMNPAAHMVEYFWTFSYSHHQICYNSSNF